MTKKTNIIVKNLKNLWKILTVSKNHTNNINGIYHVYGYNNNYEKNFVPVWSWFYNNETFFLLLPIYNIEINNNISYNENYFYLFYKKIKNFLKDKYNIEKIIKIIENGKDVKTTKQTINVIKNVFYTDDMEEIEKIMNDSIKNNKNMNQTLSSFYLYYKSHIKKKDAIYFKAFIILSFGYVLLDINKDNKDKYKNLYPLVVKKPIEIIKKNNTDK